MSKSLLSIFNSRPATSDQVGKMKKMVAGVALVALTLAGSDAFAATFTSKNTNGNWGAPGSWNKVGTDGSNTPGANDDVIILGGHTVTLNSTGVSIRSLTFKADGSGADAGLILSTNSLTVAGNIIVSPDDLTGVGIFTANIQGTPGSAAYIQANALLINGSDATSKTAQCNIATKTIINGDVAFNSLLNSRLELQGGGTLLVSGSLGTPASPGYIDALPSSSVVLTGGTTQLIPVLPNGYHNLKIEGGAKALAASTTISGNLDIINGALMVGANILTLETGATITRIPDGNYINLTGGGQMVYKGIGATPKVFPIGQNGSFNPVTISNIGTVRDFTVSLENGVSKYGQPVSYNVVNKTWNITPSGTGANATITLQWNSYEESGFNRALCGISHWDATKNTWEKKDVVMAPAGPGSISGSYAISRSGIQSFSPFAVGDENSPLPVDLLYFHAAKKENATVLTWETASEKTNKGFEVQTSADGKNYEAIGSVATKNGNANYNQRYEFLDKANRSGLVYYRLKQTDLDGTVSYYAAKVVDMGRFTSTVAAYPNPFRNEFKVNLQGASQLEVTDLTGKVVYRTASPVTGTVNVELNNQPAGLYLLKTTAAGQTTVTRLIKQ